MGSKDEAVRGSLWRHPCALEDTMLHTFLPGERCLIGSIVLHRLSVWPRPLQTACVPSGNPRRLQKGEDLVREDHIVAPVRMLIDAADHEIVFR